ncbi:MAG: ABC transporter ATP-binding protein [Bacteroidetes bacterium]|nr:ABC transporter ATP-binding protein [Bacteroidota bacterium]
MNPTTENIIEVTNVKKYFKDVKAVDGVDLEIKTGEYVALLGPNGAGKTTLVEMIEGIQKPDSGEIRINGKKWRGNRDALHKIIGISFQETRFMDKITVNETLKMFASFYDLDLDRVQLILKLINLEEKQKSYVVNLSGGQRQKLALGIALLNKPPLLLLDEPTTGLDPTARREMWDILFRLKKENNTTMILTTHYMEEAETLCDRIVIMDQGKILAKGTLDELLSENKSGEVIEFGLEGNGHTPDFSRLKGMQSVHYNEENAKGKLIVDDIAIQLPHFIDTINEQNFKLKSLECRKMTLDDLFIKMTGRRLSD